MKRINSRGFEIMDWLRDKIYSPTLKFALQNRFASLSGFIAALSLTVSSVIGGIMLLIFRLLIVTF